MILLRLQKSKIPSKDLAPPIFFIFPKLRISAHINTPKAPVLDAILPKRSNGQLNMYDATREVKTVIVGRKKIVQQKRPIKTL
jgi:hypothetical protein